ncbi:MAG: hypothetical protein KDK04_24995 [Candidatus Competibacteraceae bacterium]|nr:hypothetical protein [Candidatus Competibacteraceae bacterium]MCB1814946.1 hypothetical protein [Candidatus Competibacteraceae bacterium]
MKLKNCIDTLHAVLPVRLDRSLSIVKTRTEVAEFLRLCAALINIPPHQIMDWELGYFLNKIHNLEDDLINYQYLSDMESLLIECASRESPQLTWH